MLIRGILLKLYDNPLCFFEYINKARLMITYNFEKLKPNYVNLKSLDADETVQEILNGRSIVRLNDGEMEIIRGFSIVSSNFRQKYDPELAAELETILSSRNNNLLVCIGHTFLKNDVKTKNYWPWMYAQSLYHKYINFNRVYGDALIFRDYDETRYTKLVNYIKSKRTLVVTHNASELVLEHNYLKGALHYNIPANHASEKRYKIIGDVGELIHNKKPELVLVSGGAFAKELISELSNVCSSQLVDIGAFYDYGQEQ